MDGGWGVGGEEAASTAGEMRPGRGEVVSGVFKTARVCFRGISCSIRWDVSSFEDGNMIFRNVSIAQFCFVRNSCYGRVCCLMFGWFNRFCSSGCARAFDNCF